MPSGWEWTRLKYICNIITGASFKKEEARAQGENLIRVLRGGNIQPFRLYLKGDDIFISKELVNENILLKQYDLITPAVTSLENICKMARVEQEYNDITVGGFVFIIRGFYNDNILSYYLQCFFSSPTTIEFVRSITNKSGQAFYNIGKERLSSTLIPIPPYKEQSRIIYQIQKLLPLVICYNSIQADLNKLNDNVKPLLRKSILQEAIQGKLVSQCETDEPASVLINKIRAEKERLVKEGKLKKSALEDSIIFKGDDNKYWEKRGKELVCIDDEIPFEIPDSWAWVRIENVVILNPKNEADDNMEAAFIPMEKIEATYLSSFSYILKKWGEIKKGFTHFANGDVAFAKITPCFQNRKSMILGNLPNGIGAGTTELKVLRVLGNTILQEYLLFFLESPYFVDEATFKGTANQQRIISGYLEKKLFPLPPLGEQKRIVETIKSLWQVL